MGQSISLNNTPLGEELIGQSYETIQAMGLRTKTDSTRTLEFLPKFDDTLPESLKIFYDHPQPVNPTVGTLVDKIPAGVQFKVIAVEKYQSFEALFRKKRAKNVNLYIYIDILNNVWCDESVEYVAVYNHQRGFPEWLKKVSKHKKVSMIIRGDCKIIGNGLFPKFSKDGYEGSIEHDTRFIKKIGA